MTSKSESFNFNYIMLNFLLPGILLVAYQYHVTADYCHS